MENKSFKYEYKVGDEILVENNKKNNVVRIMNIYDMVGYGRMYDGIRLFDNEEVCFMDEHIKSRVIPKKECDYKVIFKIDDNVDVEKVVKKLEEKIKKEVEEKKYLKTWEAIKALEEGYNVKHKDWIHNQYIYKNKEGQIISNRVGPVEIDNLDNEWLIYEESKKEIPKEFEGLKYILGSINNMDCGDKDCDKCPLGMEKCDMLDEIFFDMKEKYNF